MLGFIYKDFLVMRKQLLYILFLMCLYTVLAVLGIFSPSILAGIVVILGAIYSVNAFSYDEQARWNKFAAATPAGRRGVVAGRYLFTLLLLVVTAVFVCVVLALLWLLRLTEESPVELLLPVPVCLGIGLLMNTIMLPLIYKFGVEKARYLSMVVFIAVFGACVGLGFLTSGSGLLADISDRTFMIVYLCFLLAAAILFWISYQISLHIFSRKEL